MPSKHSAFVHQQPSSLRGPAETELDPSEAECMDDLFSEQR